MLAALSLAEFALETGSAAGALDVGSGLGHGACKWLALDGDIAMLAFS